MAVAKGGGGGETNRSGRFQKLMAIGFSFQAQRSNALIAQLIVAV